MMAPPPRLAHVRHGRPRRANRREERQVESGLPLGVRRIEQAGPAGETDIVDEHIEPAEGLHRARDDQVHSRLRRHVRLHREHHVRPPGSRFDFDRRFRQPLRSPGADADATAFRHQRARAGQAEAAAGAGHDGCFVGEGEVHARSSVVSR